MSRGESVNSRLRQVNCAGVEAVRQHFPIHVLILISYAEIQVLGLVVLDIKFRPERILVLKWVRLRKLPSFHRHVVVALGRTLERRGEDCVLKHIISKLSECSVVINKGKFLSGWIHEDLADYSVCVGGMLDRLVENGDEDNCEDGKS